MDADDREIVDEVKSLSIGDSEAAPAIPTPKIRPYGNTGPKGVLNDYLEAKERLAHKLEMQRQEMYDQAEKLTMTIEPQRESFEPKARQQREEAEQLEKERRLEEAERLKEVARSAEDKDGSEDELDEVDKKFFEEYRRKRIEEMRLASQSRFGRVFHVTRDEFPDAIDNEKPDVFIVVHLYQTYSSACVRLNHCLDTLAQQFPLIKFVKAIATEVQPGFADICLPTLVIYRAGRVYKSIVKLLEYVPADFDEDDIITLLKMHKVLKETDAPLRE